MMSKNFAFKNNLALVGCNSICGARNHLCTTSFRKKLSLFQLETKTIFYKRWPYSEISCWENFPSFMHFHLQKWKIVLPTYTYFHLHTNYTFIWNYTILLENSEYMVFIKKIVFGKIINKKKKKNLNCFVSL